MDSPNQVSAFVSQQAWLRPGYGRCQSYVGTNAAVNGITKFLIDGQIYGVGVRQSSKEEENRIMAEDYPSTKEYRALFYGALDKVNESVIEVLVTGLPVSQSKDPKIVEALKMRLKGTHEISSGKKVTVKSVIVCGQPIGGYMNFVDYMDSSDRPEYMADLARVVVFDPGFYSTDWVSFKGPNLRVGESGTSLLATGRILEAAVKRINTALRDTMSVSDLEDRLLAGAMVRRFNRENVDLTKYWDEAVNSVTPDAVNEFLQSFPHNSSPEYMYLVGGGARYYAAALERAFGDRIEIITAQDPVMANALGFLSLGLDSIEGFDAEAEQVASEAQEI